MRISMINTIVYLFFALVSFGQSEEPGKSKLVYRPLEKVKVDQFFFFFFYKEGSMDDVTMIFKPAPKIQSIVQRD